MLYAKPKEEALAIHERAVTKYNSAYQKMEPAGSRLYDKRCDCVTLIHEIEFWVNSIANRQKNSRRRFLKSRRRGRSSVKRKLTLWKRWKPL